MVRSITSNFVSTAKTTQTKYMKHKWYHWHTDAVAKQKFVGQLNKKQSMWAMMSLSSHRGNIQISKPYKWNSFFVIWFAFKVFTYLMQKAIRCLRSAYSQNTRMEHSEIISSQKKKQKKSTATARCVTAVKLNQSSKPFAAYGRRKRKKKAKVGFSHQCTLTSHDCSVRVNRLKINEQNFTVANSPAFCKQLTANFCFR